MAATVGSLHVALSADTAEFVQQLNNAAGHVNGLFGNMVGAELAADAIKAAAQAAFDMGKQALVLAGNLEQSKIAFTTMLGSAEKAEAFLKDLAQFAANTPFELKGLQDASRKLLAFGFDAKNIIPIMTGVGNAVGALGGGAEEVNRVTMALGQMQAKGKISGEEMLQLAEMGIPAWDMLAKAIGVSVPKAMEMAQKGAIPAAQGIEALVNGMNERFPNMMAKQSKTLLGAWSNLEDGISMSLTNIGTDIIKTFNLTSVVTVAAEAMSAFAASVERSGLAGTLASIFGPEMKAAILGIGAAITAAAIPAIISMGPAAMAAATTMISAAGAAIVAWAPFIALAAAVAFAATPIMRYWDDLAFEFGHVWDYVSGRFGDFINWLKTGFSHLANNIVGPAVRWVQDKLSALWGALPAEAQGALRAVGMAFGDAAINLTAPFQAAGLAAGSAAKFVAGSFKESFAGWGEMFQGVQSVVQRFTSAVPDSAAQMAEKLKLSGNKAAAALGDAGKAAKKHAEQIGKAFDDVSGKLKGIDLAGALNGENSLDTLPKKVDAILGGLKHLVEMGVNPADKRFQALASTLRVLQEEMERLNNGQVALKAFSGNVSVLTALNKELKDVRDRAAIFGDTVDVNAQSAQALEKAINVLRTTMGASNPIVAKLVEQWKAYHAATKPITDATTDIEKALNKAWAEMAKADRTAALLGKSFDLAGEQGKILQDAMLEVAKVGGGEAAPAIALLRGELERLGLVQPVVVTTTEAFKQSVTDTMNAVNGMREGLATMASTLGINLNPALTGAIAQTGNFALAVVQVGTSIGPLMTAVSGLMTQIPALIASVGSGAVAFLAAVPGVNLVAGAIAAVVGVTIALTSSWDELVKFAEDVAWALPPIGIALAALKLAIETVSAAGRWLVEAFKLISTTVRKVFHDLANVVKASVNHVVRGVNVIIDGINAMADKIGFTLPRMQELTVETFEQAEAHREAAQAAQAQAQAVTDLTRTLSEGLRAGVSSAMGNAIKGFLDGTKDLTEGLRDSIKGAIIDGITQALMQGAMLKGALGGLMDQLSSGLAAGANVNGIIAQIGAEIPRLASQLESTLAPLRNAVQAAFPSAPKATTSAAGGSSSSSGKSTEDAWAKAYTDFAKNQQGAERWSFDQFFNAMGGKLPALANGALVSSATLALVGEGPKPEAVVPLSQSVFSQLASGIVGHLPVGEPTRGGETTVNLYFQVDDRTVGQRVVKELRQLGIKV